MGVVNPHIRFPYEDYKSLPESTEKRYELLDGELLMVPAPTTRHQFISRNLEFILHDFVRAHGRGIEGLLAEIARFGEATVKRIYGYFTSSSSLQWKKVLNNYAIKPVQQFAYTTGKNATDSTLIIDAMDLLYTRRFDGFCLVSSDSDFTGLALRIREEGLTVLGFGEQKTPEAFRHACHKFVFTELLRSSAQIVEPAPFAEEAAQVKVSTVAAPQPATTPEQPSREFPGEFVLQALEKASDDTGWAHLGTFGSYLTKLQPDFDARLYGFKKLSELVRAKTDVFVIEDRSVSGSDVKVLYVRPRKTSGSS